MGRFSLPDAQWEKMGPFGLGKPTDPGRTGGDARLFVEALLWIARTGSPWRDLLPLFGNWNTAFKRFRDCVKADVFERMFDAVSGDPDMEYAMVEATIVRVHRHGRAQKGDSKSGHRQVSWRLDDQNPGADRCKVEGIQASGPAQREAGHEFCRHDPSRCSHHQLTRTLNRR